MPTPKTTTMFHHKKIFVVFGLVLFVTLGSLYSCRKSDNNGSPTTDALAALNLPATPFNYANQPLPGFLRTPLINGQDNTPANNPVTDWGATLGRVLFYDKTVSINNTISCSSCHQQSFAFADN